MTRLDDASEIISLAAELGVSGSTPVDEILDFCRRRFDDWVAEAGAVSDQANERRVITRRILLDCPASGRGDCYKRGAMRIRHCSYRKFHQIECRDGNIVARCTSRPGADRRNFCYALSELRQS